MNNAHAIALRTASSCLRASKWPRPINVLTQAYSVLPKSVADSCTARSRKDIPVNDAQRPVDVLPSYNLSRFRPERSFHTTSIYHALKVPESRPQEEGLAFRSTPLSTQELRVVFGKKAPSSQPANNLLRVLHGRRVDGTLDLPLPADLKRSLRGCPDAVNSALTWLRQEYYVDEDQAIFARIEREEAQLDQDDSPSRLMQRGQNLGLYGKSPKPGDVARQPAPEPPSEPQEYFGPQSGQYRAPLSEKEGDVFGQSQFEKIRAENEAKAAAEDEALEKQIAEIQEKRVEQRAQDTALASRPEQGVEAADQEIRPPNELEKWILRNKNRGTSKLTLEDAEAMNKSAASRLLPSLLFVVAGCAGLYVYAEQWVAPKRMERLWPDMTLSFATVAGIISVNLGVWFLWKIPPAWGMLNKYFLVVPATLRPLSLLGSVFSHTGARHLLVNAVPLLVFGPSLHEDLGRGHFLALYIASGLIGAWVSAARFISQGILITSSLGASGASWGITAGFLTVHANDKFTIFFLPEDMKDNYSIRGWMFFSGLIALEVFGALTGRMKRRNINYIAHLTGAAVGWLYVSLWRKQEAQCQGKTDVALKPTRPWWQLLNPGAAGSSDRGK